MKIFFQFLGVKLSSDGRFKTLFGHLVGHKIGCGTLGFCPFEYLGQGVVNTVEMGVNLYIIMIAAEFFAVRDLDNPAGVDHIIRCVKNIARGQCGSMSVLGQLIVCRSCDDLCTQLINGRVVDYSAQRTGSKNIHIDGMNFMGVDGGRAKLVDGFLNGLNINICDVQSRTFLVQAACKIEPHGAQALNRDMRVLKSVISLKLVFHSRFDPAHYAIGAVG